MKHRIASVVAAAALGIGFAGVDLAHAQAGAVDFSFSITNDPQDNLSVTGVVDGSLLSDGNTFDVTGFSTLTVNGTPISPAGWAIEALDTYDGYPADTPAISLDGSYLNILFYNSNSVKVGFGAGNEEATALHLGVIWCIDTLYNGRDGSGQYNWTASFTASPEIPEPASVAGLIVGLAAIATMTRRRAG
jgi:hypothetical protein